MVFVFVWSGSRESFVFLNNSRVDCGSYNSRSSCDRCFSTRCVSASVRGASTDFSRPPNFSSSLGLSVGELYFSFLRNEDVLESL